MVSQSLGPFERVAEALGEKWREGPIHDHDFAANTHILAHAGRILATVEAGSLPYEITDELDTVGPYDFAGTLAAGFAAHTKTDMRRARFTPSRIRLVRIMSRTSLSTTPAKLVAQPTFPFATNR